MTDTRAIPLGIRARPVWYKLRIIRPFTAINWIASSEHGYISEKNIDPQLETIKMCTAERSLAASSWG
jgi:hypothetical protein